MANLKKCLVLFSLVVPSLIFWCKSLSNDNHKIREIIQSNNNREDASKTREDLENIKRKEISALQGDSRQHPKRFLPKITLEEHAIQMELISVVTKTAEEANLTYFLYAGSLLGSYHHHGAIPWDDDVDIIFDRSDKYKVRDALKSVEEKGYILKTPNGDLLENKWQWKIYPRDTGRWVYEIPNRQHHWPFVDIFFFRGNSSHIRCEKYDNTVKRSCVFPLVRRPYGDMMLPAPCNPAKFMVEYDIYQCKTHEWDHRMESRTPGKNRGEVQCCKLFPFFPFVSRTINKTHVRETLKIGRTALRSVELPSYCLC